MGGIVPRTFVFMKIFPFYLLLAATAFAASPNVVLIITDQQMADALSSRNGDRYLKTPAMDSLAAHGTFFTRAYAANPLCMPSRNSMFTGRYPHQTGVMDNTHGRLDPEEFPCLGTFFQRAGYETVYYGKWHLNYDPKAPEIHGFETLDKQMLDAVSADNAVKFLGRKHERPFFLVASFLNPHNTCELARGEPLSNGPIGSPPPLPELPPLPANAAPPRHETDTMALMRKGYHASPLFPVGDFTALQWRDYRWGYNRLVEKADGEIGRVLAALRDAGLDGNTVIVFTSDHGESDGAHGMNQKTVFYEESARVPLIVSYPGDDRARTNDRLVNTGIDLMPTLLDYAGIMRPANLPGRSLRPLAVEETVADWPDEVVVENDMTQAGLVDGSVPMTQGRMVRTARYKYCVYAYGNERESLIDLEKDPGEMDNLARNPDYHSILLEMRERLRKFGETESDKMVAIMLANDVGPRPFPQVDELKKSKKVKKHDKPKMAANQSGE